MEEYCQNDLCENEAVKQVFVSTNKPSDQKRSLCGACAQAYHWGVRHGRMTARLKRVWVLAVADRGIVVHGGAFRTRRSAIAGLVEYLKANEDYDGPADMPSISDWLADHDERLGVDIFPASLDAG
jgi:hypothetical protein